MEDADISRKRKTESALNAILLKRSRLAFGETITLKVTHELYGATRDFIVHRELMPLRSTALNSSDKTFSIDAKPDAVEAYLDWAYDKSCGISNMADCVANWRIFEWDGTTGRSIEKQDTICRTLGLFDLWYVGHVLEDKVFCNLVMDTICQQDLNDYLIPDLTEWVWKCRCAEGCWEGGSDSLFEGPFLWLLHRLSMPCHSVALLEIMRNEQMTHFAQSLLERMSHVQQLGLDHDPSLATVIPRHYHVIW